ncbi:uncharacterized protein DS421_11g334820 [Arachis hypogaea]|nr:uncharacterized protein DS421_11g334820 [Arachis hypogaea]
MLKLLLGNRKPKRQACLKGMKPLNILLNMLHLEIIITMHIDQKMLHLGNNLGNHLETCIGCIIQMSYVIIVIK